MDTKPPRSLRRLIRALIGIVDRCLHLESMAKTELPSRVEVTNEVMSGLERMKRHHNKIAMLRRLSMAKAASHIVGVVR